MIGLQLQAVADDFHAVQPTLPRLPVRSPVTGGGGVYTGAAHRSGRTCSPSGTFRMRGNARLPNLAYAFLRGTVNFEIDGLKSRHFKAFGVKEDGKTSFADGSTYEPRTP
jgi:hypothetical protein